MRSVRRAASPDVADPVRPAGYDDVADPAPNPHATAEQVEAARHDTKLAQVLYHDWEAESYDDKWSISYDQRCIDYARGRFDAIVPDDECSASCPTTARWSWAAAPASSCST